MKKLVAPICLLLALALWAYATYPNWILLLAGPAVLLAIWAYLNSTKNGVRTINKLLDAESKQAGLERKQADLDGLTMVYYESKEKSDKPNLVLVHGYTSNKTIWNRCAKHLAQDYHLIVPDMAGHGDTKYDPDMNYSIPSQAAWLQKLLAHLGVEKAHIAGNSMGGFIAAYFAKTYPEHTLTAMLLDPAGVTSPEQSEIAKVYDQGKNLFLSENLDDFQRFINMTMAKPPFTPKFLLKALGAQHMSRRTEHAHIFEDFFDKNEMKEDLKHIKAPTLLIWGRMDEILHVSAVPLWEAGIPDCQTIIWDDLGHVPMFEAPKRTANAMSEFMRSAKL